MSDENGLVITELGANQTGRRAVKWGRELAKGPPDGLAEASLSLLGLCIALKSLHTSICPLKSGRAPGLCSVALVTDDLSSTIAEEPCK